MVLHEGKRIMYHAKRELAERLLGQALGLLGNNPERNAKYVISAIDHIAKGESRASSATGLTIGWPKESQGMNFSVER